MRAAAESGAEVTHPPMTTKSSPGRVAHDGTRELCMHSSAPGMAPANCVSAGYWNSPAAHTTYRAVSFFGSASKRLPGLVRTTTLNRGSPSSPTSLTEVTSVSVRTRRLAAPASAFR